MLGAHSKCKSRHEIVERDEDERHLPQLMDTAMIHPSTRELVFVRYMGHSTLEGFRVILQSAYFCYRHVVLRALMLSTTSDKEAWKAS
jgi:hypothetical protein